MNMDKRVQTALEEISADLISSSKCWAVQLPEEALDLLYGIEELKRQGRRVNRRVAAEKFNELYGLEITEGMVQHHLSSGKGCACRITRDYL